MFRFITRYLISSTPNHNNNVYRREESITNFIRRHHTPIVESGNSNTCSKSQYLTTISYLKNNCGLSLDSAVLASKKVTITSTQKADSVLQLFKSYDFTQTQITNLITKCPSLIQSDPDKTLKPKFEYLESLGLSKLDIAMRFSSGKCPSFIRSVPDKLEPHVSTLGKHGVPDCKIDHLVTISYLKNKCGLSLDLAVLASKKVTITSTQKADLVYQLFKSYNFTETQITHLISKCPSLIQYDPDKTLKPKLEFLESLGLSKPDLTKLFFSGKCPTYILSDTNRMEQNVTVLRSYGMPDSNIYRLLMMRPIAFVIRNDIFRKRLRRIEEMGFCPNSLAFLRAFQIVIVATDKFWENKFNVFKSVGWSDSDIIAAFKKQPRYIGCSEKRVRFLMDFYLSKLGLKTSDVAKCPNILMLSFEKRIIPRCSVLKFLSSKGLRSDLNMVSALNMMNGNFEKMYVTKYREMFPEIMSVYQGEKETSRL